jgi:hypothetical protein
VKVKTEQGTWWCNVHQRVATQVRGDGKHECHDRWCGNMMSCDVVFAPMTAVRVRRRKIKS